MSGQVQGSKPSLPSPPGAWFCAWRVADAGDRSSCSSGRSLHRRPVGSWIAEPIAPSTGQRSACCHLADLPSHLACRVWAQRQKQRRWREMVVMVEERQQQRHEEVCWYVHTSITTRTTPWSPAEAARSTWLHLCASPHLRKAAVRAVTMALSTRHGRCHTSARGVAPNTWNVTDRRCCRLASPTPHPSKHASTLHALHSLPSG